MRALRWLVMFAMVVSLSFFSAGVAAQELFDEVPQFAKGKILVLEELEDNGYDDSDVFEITAYRAEIRIVSGVFRNQVVHTQHLLTGTPAYDVHVKVGDRVLLAIETIEGEIAEVFIADNERDRQLLWVALLFVALLVGLGGIKGLKSLLSLVLIGVLIIGFFVPLLLAGHNPILLAVIVSGVATVFTILLVGGVNRKGAAAIIGTVGGVFVAGILAIAAGSLTHITGFATQEAQMLLFIPEGANFDFPGLLMAGIIIGALGAVMDVGMSVSSAINEVYLANPRLQVKELFWAGLNVGRDIMGTMANTLILAYTGGALALLLLVRAYEVDVIRLLNMDAIATEILRALAGSIGLVAAIPVTALAAAWLHAKSRPN